MDDQLPYSITPDADFLPGAKAVMISSSSGGYPKAPAGKATESLLRYQGSIPIVYWGNQNNYPVQVLLAANQSPQLLSLLKFLTETIYGRGLIYEVNTNAGKPGKPVWEQYYDPEIETWMLDNVIQDWLLESIQDFVWFNQTFEEMIKNKKGDYIVQLVHEESTFCRMGIQNPKTGFRDKVYINANWPMATAYDDLTDVVAAIDPYDINKVQYAKDLSDYKFVYPISFPAPGKIVYQQPGWHSLFSSGWLDIANAIPVLKKALMKFQMTIKYIIEIPEEFWHVKAKDEYNKEWKECSIGEKDTIKSSTKTKMNDFLTGAENAGKSFITTFGWDRIKGQVIPGIKITALDDKLKDGKYIEDSKEASGQMIQAMGIPVPLIGPISSGDMGAGSGADVRIHTNVLNERLTSSVHKLMSPLNFVAQYNGWTKRIPSLRFNIEKMVIDTLDVSGSTTNPSPKPNPADGTANN